ncbi:MAG: type I 3-dehydroquinate dehydratase [Tissierellia bacterium]|nr:type I 3-dehydroquinate dehydratase [Tissierellia bacterium]
MKKIVALFGKNLDEIKEELKIVENYKIDIVEIRADYLEDRGLSNLADIVSQIKNYENLEIMLTLRSKREGGGFVGLDYAERILSYLDLNIDYIDIQVNELSDQTLHELIEYAQKREIKTIFSVHDMGRAITKGIFRHYFDKAKKFDADIVKIVDMPQNIGEVIAKLEFSGKYQNSKKPALISISMGGLGKISRYETNIYKPSYTFININDDIEIGQIRIEEMDTILSQKTDINFYTSMNTIIGKIFIYSNLKGVSEITFDTIRHKAGVMDIEYEDAILREAKIQLEEYFTKERKEFEVKLSYKASDFDYSCYDELKKVEYGEVISYKELAERAGYENAQRACGNAMAKNLIPIFIPCHRVVKTGGDIGQYTGGSHRKQILLDLERTD